MVNATLNSFALQCWGFNSEVGMLKWFSFDLALKLALYFFLKNEKNSHNTVCITYKTKSRRQV